MINGADNNLITNNVSVYFCLLCGMSIICKRKWVFIRRLFSVFLQCKSFKKSFGDIHTQTFIKGAEMLNEAGNGF
jgi:hypothetical protein